MEKVIPKKIIFFTLVSISSLEDRNLYSDLMRHFVKMGHHVTILSPIERRVANSSQIIKGENYKLVRFKSLNIQKTNIVEKLIATLSIDYLLKYTIKKYLGNHSFDIAIYSTPPITIVKTVSFLKEKYNLNTYLLLKDIFPQNAVDLNIMSNKGIFFGYFKKNEKKLYEISDYIGCMSQANVDYILSNNKEIPPSKVEICPNSIEVLELSSIKDNNETRHSLNIPQDAKVFIYGGNLGKPQGVNFLLKLLNHFLNESEIYFIIVGSGTEYNKLDSWLNKNKPANVILYNQLPVVEYEKYVAISDVGMIFLDYRFTIPNYPSRLLSYLQLRKPVVVFSDKNTDVGENCEIRGYGKWTLSNDLNKAIDLINYFCSLSKSEHLKMGQKGFEYLRTNYSVKNTYQVIMKHF